MARLVLFDIDGTLLLTAGAGRRAITRALAEVVSDTASFERVRFDGKTDPQIMAELLAAGGHPTPGDPMLVEQLCQRYLGMLAEELRHPATGTMVLPGIASLLERLEAYPSIVVGLLTGNLAAGAALKLSAAGLLPDRFRVGAFGSDSAHRPELPAIAARRARTHFGRDLRGEEIVIIGDTPADVTCGQAIAARAIGVATGAYGTEELAAAGAYAVFADLSDTQAVLMAILRGAAETPAP
jgi:phosphoglycolate phosphatase-like HAD superfamily hydrolase